MIERKDLLRNSLIVAAHADDEILWFNSIAADVDRILVVYCDFWAHPELGRRRQAAFAEYPRQIECLGIDESGAAGCADWSTPALTDHGIALGYEANRRALTRIAKKSLSMVAAYDAAKVATESVSDAYRANFDAICAALEPRLTADMNVFTHNPWGEYGHEEHIQVFRALEKLRDKIGFRLWMTNYCTERALPLALRYFSGSPNTYVRLPCDKDFASAVADVYRRHGCWTWKDDWSWFEDECFMEAPREYAPRRAHNHLFPLNFFAIDDEVQRRNWLPLAITAGVATVGLAAMTE
jgi:LmbE family N-acetylglucosaminyl deacetylase